MLLNSETNTCEAVQTHLVALLDNELSPEEAMHLRSHLTACPACSEVFDQIRKTIQAASAWEVDGSDIWQAYPAKTANLHEEQTAAVSQDDLRAVLTEMRALRTEIQELRGEVGTLRRLLSATQQATARSTKRSPPPEWMPVALPENSSIGLL